jgi:hypothetical protein
LSPYVAIPIRCPSALTSAALEQGVGEPLSDTQLGEEAKNLVVAMGAAEKARGPTAATRPVTWRSVVWRRPMKPGAYVG